MKAEMSLEKSHLPSARPLSRSEVEILRRDYPVVGSCAYLNHAAVSPISRGVQAAMARQTELHATSIHDAAETSAEIYSEGRTLAAKLVGGTPDRVAYIQNTSSGLSQIALGLSWKRGDNVVIPALEFPSNYLIWADLERRGVELRTVETVSGCLDADAIGKYIDGRTRAVAVSHVQFYSGFRVRLDDLGELCQQHNALLVVDGTQSVGALPFDMMRDGVDVVVVSAHKWMLGPLGIGFMALSKRAFDSIRPPIIGWLSVSNPFEFRRKLEFQPDASRFEPGTENAAGLFGLVERLRQIEELKVDRIAATIFELLDGLIEGLQSLDAQVISVSDANHRSGIMLFKHSNILTEELQRMMGDHDVITSLRNGAIRVSPHHYNTSEELARVVEVVRKGACR